MIIPHTAVVEAITCVYRKNLNGRTILTTRHFQVVCMVSSTTQLVITIASSPASTTPMVPRSTVNQLRVLSAT